MVEVLAKVKLVIIAQYIHVSNQHMVHLQVIQRYISYISIFKNEEKNETVRRELVEN